MNDLSFVEALLYASLLLIVMTVALCMATLAAYAVMRGLFG